MLKYDAVSFSYPAGDNYEIQNRSFKELMQKSRCSTPAQTFDPAHACCKIQILYYWSNVTGNRNGVRKVNLYFE